MILAAAARASEGEGSGADAVGSSYRVDRSGIDLRRGISRRETPPAPSRHRETSRTCPHPIAPPGAPTVRSPAGFRGPLTPHPLRQWAHGRGRPSIAISRYLCTVLHRCPDRRLARRAWAGAHGTAARFLSRPCSEEPRASLRSEEWPPQRTGFGSRTRTSTGHAGHVRATRLSHPSTARGEDAAGALRPGLASSGEWAGQSSSGTRPRAG